MPYGKHTSAEFIYFSTDKLSPVKLNFHVLPRPYFIAKVPNKICPETFQLLSTPTFLNQSLEHHSTSFRKLI